MKIRVGLYGGTAVNNTAKCTYAKLLDPTILEFDTHKSEGTAEYQATSNEQVTYSHFIAYYDDDTNDLLWSGLKFHKLTDNAWVMKLTEDKYLSDEFYFAARNTNGERIATFGTATDQQINMENINDFDITYIDVFEEAFCSLKDVTDLLRSSLAGRINIGDQDVDAGNTNLISLEDAYKFIRSSWARFSVELGKRYKLPIRIASSITKNYLADISAKDVCVALYNIFFVQSKTGDKPAAIITWETEIKQFIEEIARRGIPGIINKLEDGGGTFEFERG